jgi:hypothetical protein
MNSPRPLWRTPILVLALLNLAGCGGAETEPTATSTLVPATAVKTATPTAVEASQETVPSWDYVALGDSHPAGRGLQGGSFVTYYAA